MRGLILVVAFAATVPVANWMIGNVGDCSHGPCVIPVGFGLHAPSGVLLVGLALVLRDAVHSAMGWRWASAAIALGALASSTFAPPSLVVASVAAFILSELLDMVVYAKLRINNIALAVVASGVVGAVVDSAVFLLIAFGSLDYLAGQVVGKVWMSLAAAFFLSYRRRSMGWMGREGG